MKNKLPGSGLMVLLALVALTTGGSEVANNLLNGNHRCSFTTAAEGGELPTSRLQPTGLVYQGAFRLPEDPEGMGWEWGGAALTYYPEGDPDGPEDGYPGSLLGTGHDWYQEVSEIRIPVPIISPTQDVADLNTATVLQDFHNIRGDLFDYLDFEIPRVGLEYLPPQGEQTTDKLYFCWGQHMQEGDTDPSHGWCELDLSHPQPAGPWPIGDYWNYVTNDYLFAIPPDWAEVNTPGMSLATGRFRDGGQGGQGPSLLAIGPWNEGNPPAPGSTLPAVPLLLYGDAYTPGSPTLDHYHHSDEWSGGAWLTAGDKTAVIFVGTKGVGECWYGFANGVVWPDEPPYPPIPDPPYDDRGWWSTGFEGQILFYDPADLAAVARGEMEPHVPQPYATLNIDSYLFHIESSQQKYHTGAVAFDRERSLLYIFELFGDGDRPLVHVWKVDETPAPARQPDLLIKPWKEWLGDDVYNGGGQGQTGVKKKAAGKTAKYWARLYNDGNQIANFRIRGPGGAGGWTVEYYQGSKNVTGQVTSTQGWRRRHLPPGRMRPFRIEVTPSSGLDPKEVLKVKVRAESQLDPNQRDVIKAVTKVK